MQHARNDWRRWWPLMAGALVLVAAYSPLLSKFFRSLWNRSHYQHFPFVLGAFAWLFWLRLRQAPPREPAERKWLGWFGSGLVAIAWVQLALAYYVHSPWFAAVSAITLIAGFLVLTQQHCKLQNGWGIWILLWLIVPLPTHPDQQLIAVLQRQSSRLSSLFLDWFQIPHLMAGNVLHLAEKQLFVDEACSGIVSLMSIVACAVIYAVWNNRSLVHLVCLTVAGVGWATLMNVARIGVIAFAFDRSGVDWSEGLEHELLGLAVFLVAFLALVSTDQLLLHLVSPIGGPLLDSHGELPRFGQLLIRVWDGILRGFTPRGVEVALAEGGEMVSGDGVSGDGVSGSGVSGVEGKAVLGDGRGAFWGVAPVLAFAVLAGIQFVYGDWLFALEKQQSQVSQNALVLENALAINEELLPARCVSLNRVSYQLEERGSDSVFGKYSQTYEYQGLGKNSLLVSCDYPFSGGWHELAICYQGIGWQQAERRIVDAQAAGDDWDYVAIDFTGREGASAFLVYCQFDEFGQAVPPPTSSFLDYIWQRLLRPSGSVQGKQNFQVQVWTTAVGKVSEEQREQARQVLLETRDKFRKVITGSSS